MEENNITQAASSEQPFSGIAVLRISPSTNVYDLSSNKTNCDNKIKINNSMLKIATWNVKTIFQEGKLENLEKEMSRLKLDIVGISESRLKGSGQMKCKNGTMYFSGNDDRNHYNGVAIILSEDINKSFLNVLAISDRVMLIQLKTTLGIMCILQVYAPQADKSDMEVELFYDQINEALKIVKKNDILLVMGDFNSKIGQGSNGLNVGQYGLGERNERGDRLIQFCTEKDLIITNTYFKLPPRRLYTWTSPQHRKDNIVRNQIDFILINKKFRNSIKSAKTYPGADIRSDHNPVIIEMKVKLKKIQKKFVPKSIDLERLKDPICTRAVSDFIEDELSKVEVEFEEYNINDKWNYLKNTINKAQDNIIGPTKFDKRKEWMTNEIMELMDKRRSYKNKDQTKYKETHTEIRRKIRKAKETFMMERCAEIEEAQRKHDLFNVHKKIKEVINKKTKPCSILKDKNGNVLMTLESKLNRWIEYVTELFEDERSEQPNIETSELNGTIITRGEIENALGKAKNRKAVGIDNIHIEVLKELKTEKGILTLVKLINEVYKTGIIPDDWLKSTFITLPKKLNAQNCNEFRTISLMSHVIKVVLRVIHSRIYEKCEEGISETQFGFRSGFGTREALLTYNVLMQKCKEMNVDVYTCFIDYEKAFDRVKHEKLIEILKSKKIHDWDIRLIANLYWKQIANIKVESDLSSGVVIKRGVRQGCILSPLLFNMYSETIFKEALKDINSGIKINNYTINNLRYADDTVLLATNIDDLNNMVNKLSEISKEYGLNINISKTKLMINSKTVNNAQLQINNTPVELVHHYKYLGFIVNNKCDHKQEIRARIEQARAVFVKMNSLLTSLNLPLQLRLRIVKCYVFSVLYYGMESWILKQDVMKNLEAFEMWVYRRMLRISWKDRITNKTVLQRMGKECEVLVTIKKRKLEFFGHVMRNDKYNLVQLVIDGEIVGKRSVGRPITSWIGNIKEWYNLTDMELYEAAQCKKTISIMIAHLQLETAD
uniref:Craniofacial development protein 2 n=1 Tax=Cacopsylla melanoneura TaxID=428564 RepID=A0A8D8LPD3_9HEMI